MKRDRERRGFTLVEMLVVVFIIGILLALVLPAIQSARARARQQQCVSNLANLGRALQAYESANRAFPPAIPTNRTSRRQSDRFYAPHVYLLSYVDALTLAQKIDVRKRQYFLWDPKDEPLMKETVSVFLCPSDGSWSAGRPGNSYRACMGPGPYSICSPQTPCDQGIGGFRALYEHTAADIRDGLAQTVAMSEKRIGGQSVYAFDRRRDFWYTGVSALGTPLPPIDDMVKICSSLSGQPQYFNPYSGATWFIAGYEYTWYNHAVAPNSPVANCAADPVFDPVNPDFSTNGGVFGASSYHQGGVNCLFFDSHVKFMSNDVDLRLWRAISTRASGEVVSL